MGVNAFDRMGPIGVLLNEVFFIKVIFVFDIADNLFQYILNGDDARYPAKFVENYRDMVSFFSKTPVTER